MGHKQNGNITVVQLRCNCFCEPALFLLLCTSSKEHRNGHNSKHRVSGFMESSGSTSSVAAKTSFSMRTRVLTVDSPWLWLLDSCVIKADKETRGYIGIFFLELVCNISDSLTVCWKKSIFHYTEWQFVLHKNWIWCSCKQPLLQEFCWHSCVIAQRAFVVFSAKVSRAFRKI